MHDLCVDCLRMKHVWAALKGDVCLHRELLLLKNLRFCLAMFDEEIVQAHRPTSAEAVW